MKLVKLKLDLDGKYLIISDDNLDLEIHIDRSNSVSYWEKFGYKLADSIFINRRVKDIYNLVGWDSLKDFEKYIVAKVLAYSLDQEKLDEVLSIQEQLEAKLFYVNNSKIDREARWEALRQQLAIKVDVAQSLGFYSDTEEFKGKYIDVGLPHLLLWLTNGSYPALGIDYTNSGFAQASYFTEEMKQICIDYLETGKQFIQG